MNGHQLIELLQNLGDAALNLPIKVPHHQQYDAGASLEDADTVNMHAPAPWTGQPPYLTITHGTDGSEAVDPWT